MIETLVEVMQFLLAQYEGGSGPVAEQAALLQKKLEESGAVSAAKEQKAINQMAEKLERAASDDPGDPPPDEPLRAHAGRKQSRKGHT